MGTVRWVQYKKGGLSPKRYRWKNLGEKIWVKKLGKKLNDSKEKMENNFTERCSEIR